MDDKVEKKYYTCQFCRNKFDKKNNLKLHFLGHLNLVVGKDGVGVLALKQGITPDDLFIRPTATQFNSEPVEIPKPEPAEKSESKLVLVPETKSELELEQALDKRPKNKKEEKVMSTITPLSETSATLRSSESSATSNQPMYILPQVNPFSQEAYRDLPAYTKADLDREVEKQMAQLMAQKEKERKESELQQKVDALNSNVAKLTEMICDPETGICRLKNMATKEDVNQVAEAIAKSLEKKARALEVEEEKKKREKEGEIQTRRHVHNTLKETIECKNCSLDRKKRLEQEALEMVRDNPELAAQIMEEDLIRKKGYIPEALLEDCEYLKKKGLIKECNQRNF